MNLEILSLGEAMDFIPLDKTGAIRIFGSFALPRYYPLQDSDNFVSVENYFFDDMWPQDWKEYSWIDTNDPYFSGALNKPWEEVSKMYPKITKESLIDLMESKGRPEGRYILFDSVIADKILSYYEEIESKIDTLLIHDLEGKRRGSAIGKSINDIYGLNILGIEEDLPEYRRFVYQTMVDAAKKR